MLDNLEIVAHPPGTVTVGINSRREIQGKYSSNNTNFQNLIISLQDGRECLSRELSGMLTATGPMAMAVMVVMIFPFSNFKTVSRDSRLSVYQGLRLMTS